MGRLGTRLGTRGSRLRAAPPAPLQGGAEEARGLLGLCPLPLPSSGRAADNLLLQDLRPNRRRTQVLATGGPDLCAVGLQVSL